MSDSNTTIHTTLDTSELQQTLKAIQKSLEKNPLNLEADVDTEKAESALKKLGIDMDKVLSFALDKFKESISELIKMDSTLNAISKASSLTASELKNLGDSSFETASKYGKIANDYLLEVQKMAEAGYTNADSMAELSTKLQAATNLSDELADKYITASDKAYKLNGNVTALTTALDGANHIADKNNISMSELAEGMSLIGSQAASSGVEINEATAALATMLSVTEHSGSEAANAFQGILMYLQQIPGEANGEIIDEKALKRYQNACKALEVSLTTVKNGMVSLKDPMQILEELSAAYQKLNDSDSKRTNLLNAVGGDAQAEVLKAILENYDLYEQMLRDYSDGMGSLDTDAETYTSSPENSLNRLSNTWTATVGNIAESALLSGSVDGLNGLLEIVNHLTDALGSLGSIGVIGGGILGAKNIGRCA